MASLAVSYRLFLILVPKSPLLIGGIIYDFYHGSFEGDVWGNLFLAVSQNSPFLSFLVRKSLRNQRCKWRHTRSTKCLRMHKSIGLTSW